MERNFLAFVGACTQQCFARSIVCLQWQFVCEEKQSKRRFSWKCNEDSFQNTYKSCAPLARAAAAATVLAWCTQTHRDCPIRPVDTFRDTPPGASSCPRARNPADCWWGSAWET